MGIRKITRKVITPVRGVEEKQPDTNKTGVEEVVETEEGKRVATKRRCFFCQNKSNPIFTDLGNLRRFLTDRAKIVGKERSGVCSKHQRQVAKNIKYARHLALLPFVPKV